MGITENDRRSLERAVHAMRVALVTAEATEKRAAALLAAAKASPENLHKARGFYVRAKAKSARILWALGALLVDLPPGKPV